MKKNISGVPDGSAGGHKVSYEFDQSPVCDTRDHDIVKEGALGAVLTGLMVLCSCATGGAPSSW